MGSCAWLRLLLPAAAGEGGSSLWPPLQAATCQTRRFLTPASGSTDMVPPVGLPQGPGLQVSPPSQCPRISSPRSGVDRPRWGPSSKAVGSSPSLCSGEHPTSPQGSSLHFWEGGQDCRPRAQGVTPPSRERRALLRSRGGGGRAVRDFQGSSLPCFREGIWSRSSAASRSGGSIWPLNLPLS